MHQLFLRWSNRCLGLGSWPATPVWASCALWLRRWRESKICRRDHIGSRQSRGTSSQGPQWATQTPDKTCYWYMYMHALMLVGILDYVVNVPYVYCVYTQCLIIEETSWVHVGIFAHLKCAWLSWLRNFTWHILNIYYNYVKWPDELAMILQTEIKPGDVLSPDFAK